MGVWQENFSPTTPSSDMLTYSVHLSQRKVRAKKSDDRYYAHAVTHIDEISMIPPGRDEAVLSLLQFSCFLLVFFYLDLLSLLYDFELFIV